MIITVGNTKGGCGKTTVAVNLAAALAMRGDKVWLIDGDTQGTAKTATSVRAAEGLPPLNCTASTKGEDLLDLVNKLAGEIEHVIIDAGGRDSSALRAALLVSDLLLVPCQPRSFDVWAVSQISALISEAGKARKNPLKVYAFLNCADSGGMDNDDAAKAIADIPLVNYLDTPLFKRKSFSNAAGMGKCVFEYKPRDSKAVSEFTAFVSAIFKDR